LGPEVQKIRVLIVDDSVVVRRLITNVLSTDAAIEVVGVAANGKIGLDKVAKLRPDVVTLDIEMPVMDGLQAMKELHRLYPDLPVIMFSTLTERGAKASLDALALGACDYVTKPSNVGSVTDAMQCLRDDLIPKIKGVCFGCRPGLSVRIPPLAPHIRGKGDGKRPAKGASARVSPSRPARIDIVAIGVSTGGPNALAEIIPRIPATLPVPVVIVQHMPALFTRLLAERLDDKSSMHVHEGMAGVKLKAGHIWIAPGGFHMLIKKNRAGCISS